MNQSANTPSTEHREPGNTPVENSRLYVTAPTETEAVVKSDWSREYCYDKNPGEDHFHLIVGGEIYIRHGHEKLCLECALRNGLITRNRLSWQK